MKYSLEDGLTSLNLSAKLCFRTSRITHRGPKIEITSPNDSLWYRNMSNNIYKHIFSKKNLELTLQDTQDNLEDFILMLSQNTDMSTFDILTITRTDSEVGYSHSIKHPRVTTQAARVAYEERANVIPLPRRANG